MLHKLAFVKLQFGEHVFHANLPAVICLLLPLSLPRSQLSHTSTMLLPQTENVFGTTLHDIHCNQGMDALLFSHSSRHSSLPLPHTDPVVILHSTQFTQAGRVVLQSQFSQGCNMPSPHVGLSLNILQRMHLSPAGNMPSSPSHSSPRLYSATPLLLQ